MKYISSFIRSIIALSLYSISAKADGDGFYVVQYSQLPHQAGVCDIIFAGTVLSTNLDEKSPVYPFDKLPAAEFAVDDVLWGSVASSNITVGSIYPAYGFHFVPHERYLVCAFTNNWWKNTSRFDTDYVRLHYPLSVTSRPPGNAVLDGYRTMCPRHTAIPFSKINYNGSNYWTATRSLVTNLVDIARVRQDERLMRHTITSLIEIGWANSCLPEVVWNQLWLYKSSRYDWEDRNPPPTPSPPSP